MAKPQVQESDCVHGYRAAGGTFGCPVCEATPGPDSGACEHCGAWVRAGMAHYCGDSEPDYEETDD